MRSEKQINWAHDVLQIALDESGFLNPQIRLAIETAKQTMCWILEHDSPFTKNLDATVNGLRRIGIDIHPSP